MATALIKGMLQQGFTASQICIVEIDSESRERLKKELGVFTTEDLKVGVEFCGVLVLAVKPQQLFELTQQLIGTLEKQLVISIAAGIQAIDIMRWLGNYKRVIRAMPNTPSLVGAGVTGLYAAPNADVQDKKNAALILAAVGDVIWVDEEEGLHAVTAISGSGPAYVFYFIESMQQAAIELGLTSDQARQLSLQTFHGATKLAGESDEDTAALRARVTSKGGTTQQAIQTMEQNDVKGKIISAIHAANKRSRELSDEFSKL